MALFELVYTSFSLLKSKEEIQEMVDKSKKSNARMDITGCLLISPKDFFQVLEGEEKVIRSLFEKIQKDPRHTKLRVMWSSYIQNRAFGKWTMLHKQVSEEQLHLTGKATTGKELLEIIQNQSFTSVS